MTRLSTLFDRLTPRLGPLSPEALSRLHRVLLRPTLETWEDAHTICLGPRGLTLWQAIRAVDPTFPARGRTVDLAGRVVEEWARIPSAFTLRRALEYAARQRRTST